MKAFLPIFLFCLLSGCGALPSTPPRPDTGLARFYASPNFEPRRANFVILHHTSSGDLTSALSTLTQPSSGVSSHYLLGREGEIFQLVAESERAWHAGLSFWGGQTDMNSASIGIELDNNGEEAFPPAQIEALLNLLRDIRLRHAIPRANFLGHADIAPSRKNDPGVLFPWALLAAEGFGLWCDPPPNAQRSESFIPSPAPDSAFFLALAAFGYDPREPKAALSAFRRHFYPAGLDDETGTPGAGDAAVLECLLEQKRLP
ncbi:MAG: N-acetylmuramoyl-L-alanine amidase [Betaproteobacteria bacterium]|nr:N-acetylmuramoyl-L-alanine amidase [Betaproteobacteria bacterium]